MRLATYTTVLECTAPRLLSRDILLGKDQQIRAVLKVIAQTKPNILALQSFDWDAQLRAARAFKDALNAAGWAMPYLLVPRPKNAGAKAVADPSNIGIPSLDAVDWPNKQPGNLRVSYILPSRDFLVHGSAVHWPTVLSLKPALTD